MIVLINNFKDKMKKIIVIPFITMLAMFIGYNVYVNQGLDSLSNVVLANAEALAAGESGSGQTWQVGVKTITSTTAPGWTYDGQLNVWVFKGQVTASKPPTTESVKINCCRAQGPLDSCSYEPC